ncbi:hypothetical protein ACEPAF_5231 [Sanghuangporus sanghuang]|uniref:NAD-binding protein n=1 Tax=Sanghuangporus baumii TaxID=108892 RepID=A0A9Q5HV99_SANBA|nr:NAD-binding protein [Sanghuangporus baumii]
MSLSTSQPLAGKIALITGSSRGIGAAIAHRLVLDGASVVVNYVNNAPAAQQVVSSLNAHRANSAVSVKADVSSPAQARFLYDETIKAFGRVDILILNAGIMGMKTLGETDEEFYDAHFNANVKGPLFLVKAAAPSLAPGSRIIFFSTSLAHASMVPPTALVYAAAKGAIEQLTRVLAKDLGQRGVAVNCIAPGPIDTELFHAGKTEQQVGFFVSLHPEKRLGRPEEVANVAAFLAGPGASWVNGQTLMVNGAFVV